MGYDRGDSFPFDFEQNGNPFGSKSKGKLSPRSYPIQCERKWNTSFLSALGYVLYDRYVKKAPVMTLQFSRRAEVYRSTAALLLFLS